MLPPRFPFLPIWIFCALAVSMAGCGGSSQSTFDSYDGTRRLPTTQTIPHPDSLRNVQLVSDPDSVKITLDRSYGDIVQDWSAQVGASGPFRPYPFNTFATLQSRELTLASLARRERIRTLTPDRARKRVEETLETYQKTIAFRVHLYIDARRISAPLSTLRKRVVATLSVNGEETFDALRTQKSNIQLTSRGGGNVYQYPITVYFRRHVDGRDLLMEGTRFVLSVRPFPTLTELYFEWQRSENKRSG